METNILWFSDIHLWNKEYEQRDNRVKNYIDSFIDMIKNVKKEYPNIKYCIISGDLVQRGDEESFNLFKDVFIKPITLIYPEIKFLIIPGNHDINWGVIKEDKEKNENPFVFLKNFIESRKNENNSETLYYLKKEIKRFEKNFHHYTDFIFKCYSDKNIGNNFTFKKQIKYSDNKGLYGIVIDDESKIIFALLNTAWFSFGYTFIEYLTKYLEENISDKEPQKIIQETLNTLNILNEYGNQRVYAELISRDFAEACANNNDYLVFTCMHHPLNWIREDEKIQFKDDQVNHKDLNSILIKTDALLTGHEHMDKMVKINYLNNNILHLQAGKLLNINEDILNNRFSILTIDSNSASITEKISFTEPTDDLHKHFKWNEKGIKKKADFKSYLQKDDNLNDERKSKLIETFKEKHLDYINLKLQGNSVSRKIKTKDFLIYTDKSNEYIYVCCWEKKYFEGSNLLPELHKAINKSKIKYAYFIGLDFCHDNESIYKNNKIENREDNYHILLNRFADPAFNKFRNAYFNSENNKEIHNNLKNVKFVNAVIAYWKFEDFVKNNC